MTPAERDAVDARFALALMKAGDIERDATAQQVERAIDYRLSSATRAVPLLRTGYVEPTWLRSLADVFRRVELALAGLGPPVFATFSGPSQTGKSDFTSVAMARLLALYPQTFMATLSYGAALALPRSRRIREDVQALGVELRDDSRSVEHWQTKEGGGLLATGISGPLTGQPGLGLIVGDDYYKDEAEAMSPAVNRELQAHFDGVILTRLGPRTSVLVMFARWDTRDLIGWIRSRNLPRWEHHTLPVLDADGNPVPRIPGKDRAFYENQRANMTPERWVALMMGEPRPRGGRLFLAGAPTYRVRPEYFDRICIGVDFAYSSRRSSDHNAAVVVGMATGVRPGYYVLKVVRRQCGVVEWANELRRLADEFQSASMHAYIGGTEKGAAEGIEEIDRLKAITSGTSGLRIKVTTTRQDKYTRAQPTAAKWNGNEREVKEALEKIQRGELVSVPALTPRTVLLPEAAPWDVRGFIDRTEEFTGIDGGVDDEQDALVAACDACGPLLAHVPLQQPGRLDRSVW